MPYLWLQGLYQYWDQKFAWIYCKFDGKQCSFLNLMQNINIIIENEHYSNWSIENERDLMNEICLCCYSMWRTTIFKLAGFICTYWYYHCYSSIDHMCSVARVFVHCILPELLCWLPTCNARTQGLPFHCNYSLPSPFSIIVRQHKPRTGNLIQKLNEKCTKMNIFWFLSTVWWRLWSYFDNYFVYLCVLSLFRTRICNNNKNAYEIC